MAWDPIQYERFKAERSAPFYTLAGLIQPRPGLRVVDLGCGTGELTRWLHEHLAAKETVGVDASPEMLAKSEAYATKGLRFTAGDIATLELEPVDLIISNAALQWVPGHRELVPRLLRRLKPGGQLAVQVPAQDGYPTHRLAAEVASEQPFQAALGGWVRRSWILPAEEYATLLAESGVAQQHVRDQIFLHRLPGWEALVEWVKGSLLTAYQRRLSPELFQRFLARYTVRLQAELGGSGEVSYPFRRRFFWARL